MTTTLSTVRPSIVVEDYMHLAYKIAYKYKSNAYEDIRDTEVFSVACESLIRAAREYSPEIGEFSIYAWRVMKNGILQSLRYAKRKKRTARFKELTDKEWADLSFGHANDDHVDLERIRALLSVCDMDTEEEKQDKRLLIQHYINQVSVKNLAEIMQVSRMTIHNRLSRISHKIRKLYFEAVF